MDMLHKVELLVACGSPEVLTVVSEVFFFLLAFFVGEGHAALFSKGRVGEDVIVTVTRISYESLGIGDHWLPVYFPDIVQEHVHQGKPSGPCDYFVTTKGFVFQEAALFPVQLVA
jgi:hypothetical protein